MGAVAESRVSDDVEDVSVISVRELVNQRLSEAGRWNLALVQRDEVWDDARMRHLLDSLLAGYPVGAILLTKVRNGGRELAYQDDGTRRPQDARRDSWQVLDGQQRINALFSMFTDQGHYGSFLLNMLMPRPKPSPAQARRRKEQALPHIAHQPTVSEEGRGVALAHRERHVDLSRWAAWVSEWPGARDSIVEGTVGALLTELDPEFNGELTIDEQRVAADNLRRLLRAWNLPSIPILKAELDSPLDVLEVFTRINLGGVQVAGADVYFAGVKTFWHDAERRIDELLAIAPALRTRLGALRFLSRLASRAVGHGDALPLTIDRLAGRQGAVLREAMEELTSSESVVMRRISAFSDWYLEHSELRYGLHRIAGELWDEVLAWVASSARSGAAWWSANLDDIDAYFLGATLFRYRAVMGDAFRRVSFIEALDAGSDGLPFPLTPILAATRSKTKLEGVRGRRVRPLVTEEDRYAVASVDPRLLTVLAQRIPYAATGFDWDHIIPQALAGRMTTPGKGGRRRHHPDRRYINSTGNFWALPLSANRQLRDLSGRAKFDRLEQWMWESEGVRVWSRDRWSIEPAEVEHFIEVDRLLKDRETIDDAMRLFVQTASARAMRLFDDALERFPRIREFASGENADVVSPSAGRYDYRDALQLRSGDPDMRGWERSRAKRRLVERATALLAALESRLRTTGQLVSAGLWRSRGQNEWLRAHVVLQLTGGNCIELILRWSFEEGARFEVKAYPLGSPSSGKGLYSDFRDQPLGVAWSSTEIDVLARFEGEIERLESAHPLASD